jgi:hypothetical protein
MTDPAVTLTPSPDDGLGVGAMPGARTSQASGHRYHTTCESTDGNQDRDRGRSAAPLGRERLLPFPAHVLARAGHKDYSRWLGHVQGARGCSHPVRLTGEITDIDPTTGELIRRVTTSAMPDGVLYVPCGTRRASICPACAETYRRDAYQIVKAGLDGGKGIPADIAAHPAVFVTFTAPSFGLVHTRAAGPGGRTLRCRPRRKVVICPHGRRLSCGQRHKDTDTSLGKPLCPDCYDHDASVVWNAHAPELWRRTMIGLRRQLDRLARPDRIKLSYAKVAEFQARGVIHFHALLRLDGYDPADPAAIISPPPHLTSIELGNAIRRAVAATWFATVSHPVKPAGWDINWGTQLDIRPVSVTPDGDITSGHVAGYLAKYATKATEPVGLAVVRITSDNINSYAAAPTHQGRLIRACWKLGATSHPDFQALRRWAHMLGYRGHFLTKSRRYSVTFKALRAARATWQRRQEPFTARTDPHLPPIRLTLLTYTGTGWRNSADALLALSAAARAREHEQIAREETRMI